MSALGPTVPTVDSRTGREMGRDNDVVLRVIALIGDLHQELLILARRDFIDDYQPAHPTARGSRPAELAT